MRPARGMTFAAGAVIATSLALSGCAPAGERIPQPTAEELSVLNEQVRDLQWQNLQFSPDSPRPNVDFEHYIDPEASDEIYSECMMEAGYPGWEPNSFGAFGGPPAIERLDLYICVSRFPLHPSRWNLFTTAQRDAIYDYYRDSLVPCLAAAGLPMSEVPSREDYLAESFFGWNPYNVNFEISNEEVAAITSKCGDLTAMIGGE
jgi:hypothetical protein